MHPSHAWNRPLGRLAPAMPLSMHVLPPPGIHHCPNWGWGLASTPAACRLPIAPWLTPIHWVGCEKLSWQARSCLALSMGSAPAHPPCMPEPGVGAWHPHGTSTPCMPPAGLGMQLCACSAAELKHATLCIYGRPSLELPEGMLGPPQHVELLVAASINQSHI